MFNQESNIANPTEEILTYLKENQSGCQSLRRRAVAYLSDDGRWVLQACVVEGIAVNRGEVKKQTSRCYAKAVLFEDWLSLSELENFIEQLLQGHLSLGEYKLEASTSHRRWAKERQPLSNDYMSYAGYVWTSKFHDQVNGMYGELLAPQQPYYPDLHEAVKDWLPFPIYRRSSDSKKGEVILLLPETRAYFKEAISDGDSIDLYIAGVGEGNLSLEVKGAWWDDGGIHHFSENVAAGRALLNVPETARRLDYVLVDTAGTVYDFQKEEGYRHTGLGRTRRTDLNRTYGDMVREACRSGEGPRIEFKPLVRLENGKLVEIFKTVAAFANAEGGTIFLGINDDCEIQGIDEDLQEAEQSVPNETTCAKYLGKIRGRIRDKLHGEFQMDSNQTVVDGRRVVVIEISEAQEKPVTIQQDLSLYIRRGSSNVRTSPREWATISNTSRIDVPLWMRRR